MIVISPRAKIVLFALLIGFILIILLSIAGFNDFYNVRYVVVAPALIVLFVILMILERYRKKRQP
jgi:cell division protein FtsW (lipid II flippase)